MKSAITPGIASVIERPIHRGVYRPLGGGRRKSISARFADILKGRTAIAYDPQDLTTLFQDAAGTLPVYRPGTGLVDPPVGLMLDKSGGGYHASQSTTTARPTLSGRYNILLATETLSTQSVTTVATNYTLSFSGTGTITLSGTATGTYSAGTHTITCTGGTLTCTVAGAVTKADLRASNDGVGLPPYQRVGSATTYDTAGFPLYLRFDGVDDFLQTAGVDLTGTNKVVVGLGWRKNTVAGQSLVLIENTVGVAGHIGAFTSAGSMDRTLIRIAAPNPVNTLDAIGSTVRLPPATVVSVGVFGEEDMKIIDNGETTYGASYIPSTFSNIPFFIGSRRGSSLFLRGNIHQLCIIGSLLSTSEQAVLERYLNAKTRAY